MNKKIRKKFKNQSFYFQDYNHNPENKNNSKN